jgi:methionyl aminopeptidase
MIFLKSDSDMEQIRKAGNILSECLSFLSLQVKPGVTGLQIDKMAEDFIISFGGTAACKNFEGFPAAMCISINSGAAHNIPTNKPFLDGDVVKLDLVVDYNGFKADSAITVLIPPVKPEVRMLAETTYTAMLDGIEQAIEGKTVLDISQAIFNASKGKCGVIKEFTGHGIGRNIHEGPSIPNVVVKEKNALIVAGQVLCIEPIFCTGDPAIYYKPKEWNTWMLDGGIVSHWEHTLVVNHFPLPPTVLTKRYNETF